MQRISVTGSPIVLERLSGMGGSTSRSVGCFVIWELFPNPIFAMPLVLVGSGGLGSGF